MSDGSWARRQWELLSDLTSAATSTSLKVAPVSTLIGLAVHDYVAYTYVGSNITEARFYTGGSGGTLVSTLQFSYDASGNIIDVTRT